MQSLEFWNQRFAILLSKKEEVIVPQCSVCQLVGYDHRENFAAHHTDQWIGCSHCKESHHRDNFCACGTCFFQAKAEQDQRSGYVYLTCPGCNKKQIWD